MPEYKPRERVTAVKYEGEKLDYLTRQFPEIEFRKLSHGKNWDDDANLIAVRDRVNRLWLPVQLTDYIVQSGPMISVTSQLEFESRYEEV